MLRGVLTRRTRFRDPDGPHPAGHPAPLRQHARPAPGRARDHARRRELVGPARGAQRARRHGAQRRASPATRRSTTCTSRRSAPIGRTTRSCASTSRPTSRTSASRRRPGPGCSATAGALDVEPRPHRARGLRRPRSSRSTSNAGEETVVEKIVSLFTSRDTGISEPGRGGLRLGDAPGRRLRRAARAPRRELAPHLGSDPHRARRRRRPGAGAAPAPLPPPADGVEQLGRARRRCPGPGAARRGLPRSRVLGRAVHLPVPQPAASRSSPARCCSTATAGSTRRAGPPPTPGYAGAMFPWQSASSGREETQTMHLNPNVGPLAARRLAPAASRQRGDRLQHLAVLPGDRRPRVPALLRRRDDPRDRPVLGQRRDLRPRARPLRDQGRHGSRRVPRGLPRPRRAGSRQQRLHEPDGRVVPVPGLRHARGPAAVVGARAEGAARAHRAGARPLGRHQPQDAGLLPRRRHQPVRGLRAARRARLRGLPAAVRRHLSASIASSRAEGDSTEPLQGRQAGRRDDAVLPAVGPRSSPSCSSGSATTATTT